MHCKISPIKYCNISKKIINKTFNFCHLAILGSFDIKFFLKKNYLKAKTLRERSEKDGEGEQGRRDFCWEKESSFG